MQQDSRMVQSDILLKTEMWLKAKTPEVDLTVGFPEEKEGPNKLKISHSCDSLDHIPLLKVDGARQVLLA